MCTTISHKAAISGSAKGPQGWFAIDQVCVGYDHPFHVALEHALNIDFVNEAAGPGARVAVELDRASARSIALQILAAVDEADAYERAAALAVRAR